MASSRVYQTEAIVIKRTKLGEADRILTLYTPDFGKIRAVAKGTRRTKSKLGGHVELLTHSLVMLARGRNLDIITQGQTIESFLNIKSDLWRLSCGLYVSEFVDAFTMENVRNHRLFNLLIEALHQLCETNKNELALRYFELNALDYLGYRPQVQCCAACGSPLKPAVNFFSSGQGGVLCHSCGYHEPAARQLSLNALKVMRLWQKCDYATASRVKLNSELSFELEQVMREYVKYLLEKRVKSVAWLDRLRQEIQQKAG